MVYDDDHGSEPLTPIRRRAQSVPSPEETIAARERDTQFAQFYKAFAPALVRFLLWHGADLTVAADVAQEAMRRAYKYWDQVQQPKAWVRVVAGRELTRRFIEQEHSSGEQIPERPALLADPATLTALSEERQTVLQLLGRLPMRQRQVMAWTCDGYSPQEISQILQITDEAVRSNLYKARKALTKLLNDREVPGD